MKNGTPSKVTARKKVLVISSGGGHWVQLLRLEPALEGHEALFATTRPSYASDVRENRFVTVPDCNRWNKLKVLKSAFNILYLIVRENPDAILSTGAAPGYLAIRIGKALRKRTIWVDSIANAEELSLSGIKAGRYADHWITQWEHLSSSQGPAFYGNVLGDELTKEENLAEKPKTTNLSKRKVLVTVGTDLPFDRLVKAIDKWAPLHPDFEIFAQVGRANYLPKNIPFSDFIEPPEFKKRFKEADFVISHAGMGTILSSLSYQKRLIVLPRISALGEHRNEHQLATAKHLKSLNKINVASDEQELLEMLVRSDGIETRAQIGTYASSSLTDALKSFISR